MLRAVLLYVGGDMIDVPIVESRSPEAVRALAELCLGEMAAGAQRLEDSILRVLVAEEVAQARAVLLAAGVWPEAHHG